jgi:HlyD family type I secretion membrane fusion protein
MPAEVRFGYLAISVFIVGLLTWAALIPLATGAIAPGVVSVEGNSKIVQHLSGGLVREIHTKEGELVKKGAKLISLDEKPLKSRFNALNSQFILLQARSSRLEAESMARNRVTYSEWLLERTDDAEVAAAINSQERIFQSGLNLLREQEATYQYRISQARTLIDSNQQRLYATNARVQSASAELSKYQQLLSQGLVTRTQTYSLDNAYRDIQDTQESLYGSIGSTQALIQQYQAERSEAKMASRNQAAKLLNTLQEQLATVEKDLNVTRDLLSQTSLRAPISGYVVNLMVNTIGGVVSPGQTVMEIVPNNRNLIIKTNVNTQDRASIKVGQSADVRFSAFNQRSTQAVKGQVVVLSADRIIDPITNIPYYSADIELTEDPSVKLNGEIIHPGMQAEVIISTGKRTTLDYLLSPLTQSFNRALRED